MDKIFKYCLLKYRPSYVLSEQVNIGVLFMFADDNHLVFEFPNKLQRLSALFPDTDLFEIRKYLQTFQRKAAALAKKNLFVAQQFDNKELINNEFLIADANSFFFSEWKVGTYINIEKTVAHFSKQYFAPYQTSEEVQRKDDEYLVKQFHQTIKATNKSAFFQKDKQIIQNGLPFDFNICWQNGTTNLVRSLSFDLKNENYFLTKAMTHYGEITQLISKGFEIRDKCFDFLLLKPNSPTLFRAYDKAVNVLDDIQGKHRLIEDDKFDNYVEEAIESVKNIDFALFADLQNIEG
jgi:hypothetical protein